MIPTQWTSPYWKTKDEFYEVRDREISKKKDGRFQSLRTQILRNAQVKFPGMSVCFDRHILESPVSEVCRVGGIVEDTIELIKKANSEVKESAETLKDLANQVSALTEVVHPHLLQLVRDLRANRMAVVSEVHQSLNELRELRKFFLDSDYTNEMARLERFVALCREFQTLKRDGVLDIVSDVSIRLALQEEHKS